MDHGQIGTYLASNMDMIPNTIQDILLKLVICEPATLETGCWEWPGTRAHGYGHVKFGGGGKTVKVHRLVYEHFVGPIPPGHEKEPHHRCEKKACANFEHLVLLTPKEHRATQDWVEINKRKQIILKTHCKRGHLFDQGNTRIQKNGTRACRTCMRMHMRNFRSARRVV